MKHADSDINVCAVFPNGAVKIYEPAYHENTPRKYIRSMFFSTYGHAIEWASEYEAKERIAALARKR